MKKIELKAEVREVSEKRNTLKENKQVPWVVYGHHQEPINLKVNNSDVLRILNTYWKSHVVSLEIGKKKMQVLFKEIQKDPVLWSYKHIDFYAITAWEKITTEIPLKFVWDSEAQRLWAILQEHLKEIEVKCQSEDLVDFFEVDLSPLKEFDDVIKVADLGIDTKKFDILTKLEEIVVIASEPAVQTVEDEAPTAPTTETEKTEDKKDWE